DRDDYCVQDSVFEPVLREMLLNYDSTRAWRVWPVTEDQLRLSNSANPKSEIRNPKSEIIVDHDGLYRLTYADLRAAGMDVDTVDPRAFRLTSQGRDVAIHVAGEADGRFDPGDSITFYGQKFRGTVLAERYADEMAHWLTLCRGCELAGMLEKYTDENVYWLTVGAEPGPRMATVDGTPTDTAPVPVYYRATVHAEESREWYTHHFAGEDTWFWERIQPGPADATRTYTTTLTALATEPFSATVRAAVASRSSNAGHHTQFYLNGGSQPLDDASWDGKSRHTFEAQVPQSQLREGVNQLSFVILYNGAFEDMYFDWFEIEYARRFRAHADQLILPGDESGVWQYEIEGFTSPDIQVYDVSDPLAPRRVLNPRITSDDDDYSIGHKLAFEATHAAGARYLAVATPAVEQPKAIARYVPPDFKSTTGAEYLFITHRDFITATQTLADYRASRSLRTMVVDVADLYNEFNYGIFHPIAIRNFLAYAFATWEIRPTYVLLVGDGHWNLKGYSGYDAPPIYMPPNLAWVDPWQGEVDSTNLLAAVVGDDILPDLAIGRLPVNSVDELNAAIAKIIAYEQAEPGDWQRHVLFVADNVPDAAGDFVWLADDVIANHLPAGVVADRIYLNDYCGSPASPPTPCPAVNTAIVDTLNETGALLVSYIGHASVERWAHEQVFANSDISALANGDRLPVVLSMTCLDGYWIHPNRSSLAEELVRAPDRGAVAAFSPTGLGVATGHHILQRRFYGAVFQDGVAELGPATLAARLALFATGGNYDLIHTFTIFGDPALRLQLPPSRVYLPLVSR
ncbi:MAG: C25 family cysteine peptidase, partial [Anaerolineae bacterium]